MNGEVSFRIIFVSLWILFLTISYARRPQELGGRAVRERLKAASESESRLDVALRVSVFFVWAAALILYTIYPDWMMHYTILLPLWLRWAGVGVAIGSLLLQAWSHQTLGKQFSIGLVLREDHRLVTGGPYRWMRHPMYTSESLFMIALAVESANWLVAPPIVTGIPLLYLRAGKEEAMLMERFGDEYRSYMKRTGRFLPHIRPSTPEIHRWSCKPMKESIGWRFTRESPCLHCYGWSLEEESVCSHEKYECPTCGRKQCVLHWPYPMKTQQEAVHFLKSAEELTGKRCFVKRVTFAPGIEKWKIFTSEEDYQSYMKTRKHKR